MTRKKAVLSDLFELDAHAAQELWAMQHSIEHGQFEEAMYHQLCYLSASEQRQRLYQSMPPQSRRAAWEAEVVAFWGCTP